MRRGPSRGGRHVRELTELVESGAYEAGVRILGRRCRMEKDRVVLGEPVPARPG